MGALRISSGVLSLKLKPTLLGPPGILVFIPKPVDDILLGYHLEELAGSAVISAARRTKSSMSTGYLSSPVSMMPVLALNKVSAF